MGHYCPVCKMPNFFGYSDRCGDCIMKLHSEYCDILGGWCHETCTYKLSNEDRGRASCACPPENHPNLNNS